MQQPLNSGGARFIEFSGARPPGYRDAPFLRSPAASIRTTTKET
ncbi:hypothetical protein [Burkholderia sp. SRS-W-2-2016]|nr:hypothetical protein [Burkholderia sp. SRS-W-2-2016]